MNLLILGAGQYGSIVYEIAQSIGKFKKIDFLDDNNDIAVGTFSDIEKLKKEYSCGVVAIGHIETRMKLLERLEKSNFNIPVLISPHAYVSPTAKIEKGSIIEPMAVVHANSKIGEGCFICAGAVVNHNAVVEKGCQVDCNSTVFAGETLPSGSKRKNSCI